MVKKGLGKRQERDEGERKKGEEMCIVQTKMKQRSTK